MYTETTLDHFHAPRHVGVIDNANAVGRRGTYGQGPFMVLYVRIEAEIVSEARFQTYGCPAAIACGSWLCEWITGRPVAATQALRVQDLEKGLGGLPLGKEHCSQMAIETLQNALAGQANLAASGDQS